MCGGGSRPPRERTMQMTKLDRGQYLEIVALTFPGALWICAALLFPIIQLVWFSFLNDAGRPSLENYAKILEPLYGTGLRTTLGISATVTFGTMLLGYPLCYMIHL